MSVFASTSPSYLILSSLDKLNERLLGYKASLASFLPKVHSLKHKLSSLGYSFVGDEPLKLTISAKSYGYFGYELAEMLFRENIYAEFYDRDFLVLMLSPDNSDASLEALVLALSSIEKRCEISEKLPTFFAPVCKISPREAVFLPFERIQVSKSRGKILALSSVSCPPAVPILVPGELIDDEAVKVFEYYGIKDVFVLK